MAAAGWPVPAAAVWRLVAHSHIPVAPAGSCHSSFPRKDSAAQTGFLAWEARHRDSAGSHRDFPLEEARHRDSVDSADFEGSADSDRDFVVEVCRRGFEEFHSPNTGLAPLLFAPDLDSMT